jgi:hypothetical protein
LQALRGAQAAMAAGRLAVAVIVAMAAEVRTRFSIDLASPDLGIDARCSMRIASAT